MDYLKFLLFILAGLSLGSFFSVILFRLDRESGILAGRSKCRQCLQQLKWIDLIPVLSWIFLRGKCRYCSTRISVVYLATELITSITVVLYFIQKNPDLDIHFFYYLTVSLLFLLLVFFDAVYMILPDKISFSLAGLAFVYNFFAREGEWISLLVSGFLFGLAFAIIYIVSRGEWMGFGDAKLAFAIGLSLGYYPALLVIISAVWAAAATGIVLIITGRASLKTALPFGSFLSSAAVIFIIFRDVIEEKIRIIQQFL